MVYFISFILFGVINISLPFIYFPIYQIGMLKDPKIIQEVVFSYRNIVTPKFCKLYRLFKSLRKQVLLQDSKSELEQGLQEVLANQMKTIKEQIDEYFQILKVKSTLLNIIKIKINYLIK